MTTTPAATALPNAATNTKETTAMTTTAAADQAVDYIDRTGHVTFVELAQFAEAELGIDPRGDYCLEVAPNVILWAGCSPEFVDLVQAVRATGRIDINSTTPLVYMIDGSMLTFPLAKRPPKGGYRSPRWLPVVLHSKPGHAAGGRP